jgi:hypothetical protein
MNLRKERIERLLAELEYEITRGVLENEIEPDLHWMKLMPFKGHYAQVELHLFETSQPNCSTSQKPRLKLVE